MKLCTKDNFREGAVLQESQQDERQENSVEQRGTARLKG
jgi:hypothetical protein